MLNPTDLQDYINNFFGFGNFEGSYWFIGIEEGGGNSEQEVQNRIDSWRSLGSTNLVDNGIHHQNIGITKFFTVNNVLQKTWDKLIVVYATISCLDANNTALRKDIQRTDWGRIDSNNCLMELFPLPSPNSNDWHYNEWSALPFLATRDLYKPHVVGSRMNFIREKIQEHKPKLVLMYGGGLNHYWFDIPRTAIANWNRGRILNNYWHYYKQNETLYAVTPHPVGVYGNAFWIALGHRIVTLI